MQSSRVSPTPLPASPQDCSDHARCVESALARAEALCAARGERLTPLRRSVLELVWSSHEPRGAYEILELLRAARGPVAPPTVYRALDFLRAQRLIHRIESRNAFIGCPKAGKSHSGQFLICSECGIAQELDEPRIAGLLDRAAARHGFQVAERTVELIGRCGACQARKALAS